MYTRLLMSKMTTDTTDKNFAGRSNTTKKKKVRSYFYYYFYTRTFYRVIIMMLISSKKHQNMYRGFFLQHTDYGFIVKKFICDWTKIDANWNANETNLT